MGGIFICTSQRPELNSTVGIRIKLPNGQPLQTTARVVHIQDVPDPGGVGLAFSQGDRVFMHLLERYFSPGPKK